MDNSLVTAQLFNITYLPDAGMAYIHVDAISGLNGKVTATVELIAYGYKAISLDVNPCDNEGFKGMCPMVQGQITLEASQQISADTADQIPGASDGSLDLFKHLN